MRVSFVVKAVACGSKVRMIAFVKFAATKPSVIAMPELLEK